MFNLEYLKNKKETWEIVLPFPVTIMDGFLINTSPKNYYKKRPQKTIRYHLSETIKKV